MKSVETPSVADLKEVVYRAHLYHLKYGAAVGKKHQKILDWLNSLIDIENGDTEVAELARDVLKERGQDKCVERMLAISTAHIAKATASWLKLMAQAYTGQVIVYRHGIYGWLINVPADEEAWTELGRVIINARAKSRLGGKAYMDVTSRNFRL